MRKIIFTVLLVALAGCTSTPPQQIPSGNFNAVEAAKTRISLGLTYLENGNYNQAKSNLDRALEFAPRLSEAHFGLAYYFQVVSEFELAEKYYQQAMALDNHNPDLHNSYGAFLCQTGNYVRAEEYLLKAVNSESYSNTAETYENLAICSHSQAKINEAIGYLETALQHQPGRGKSWYMLIELLLSKRDFQAAKTAFRQYEKLVPVTADTLMIAIEIERGLGNDKVARGYQEMLNRLYPDRATSPRRQLLAPVEHSATARANVVQVQSPSAAEQSVAVPPLAREGVKTHVLQKGENLYRLAIKYGVRIQWLIDWNNISDVSNLSVGQEIIVSNPNP